MPERARPRALTPVSRRFVALRSSFPREIAPAIPLFRSADKARFVICPRVHGESYSYREQSDLYNSSVRDTRLNMNILRIYKYRVCGCTCTAVCEIDHAVLSYQARRNSRRDIFRGPKILPGVLMLQINFHPTFSSRIKIHRHLSIRGTISRTWQYPSLLFSRISV